MVQKVDDDESRYTNTSFPWLIDKVKFSDFTHNYHVDMHKKTPRKRSDEYYNIKTRQSFGPNCSTPVRLKRFGPEKVHDHQMFFLETSGRSKLSPRQACSV